MAFITITIILPLPLRHQGKTQTLTYQCLNTSSTNMRIKSENNKTKPYTKPIKLEHPNNNYIDLSIHGNCFDPNTIRILFYQVHPQKDSTLKRHPTKPKLRLTQKLLKSARNHIPSESKGNAPSTKWK